MPVIADANNVVHIDVVMVDLDREPLLSRWTTIPGDVLGTWNGDDVKAVLDLVAALPDADQMRCFLPRYGIRLRDEASVLGEVAFCFECRNAKGIPSARTPEMPEWFAFDPESAPAQELLRRFRQLAVVA